MYERVLLEAGRTLIRRSHALADSKRYDEQSLVSYVLGATALRNILKNDNDRITKVYVVNHNRTELLQEEVLALARDRGIAIEHDRRYASVWGSKAQHALVGEFEKWDDHLEPGSHVVLVNPALPANAGAIMRSALAFGIRNVAVISSDFDVFSPSVVRASMGARLDLHAEVFPTLERYRERFPENSCYAFMLDAAEPLAKVEKRVPYSIVVGNESVGLPPEFSKACQPVFIEQSGQVDSLNVATATGIALREFALATGAV
ncbi:MAG: hypothetical protein IJ087_17770 [Eggerthellaceae bacterium]|nr:hypothetical protein [Eggerthellaceae bacterium]